VAELVYSDSTQQRDDRGAVTCLACFSGCRRYCPDQPEIAYNTASRVWKGEKA